jgi:hypothetical protein
MTPEALTRLENAAHKAGIENENAWLDLQHAEKTVVTMRFKSQQAALTALHAQIALEAAHGKLP